MAKNKPAVTTANEKEATETNVAETVAAPKEPTSEKLEELKAKQLAARKASKSAEIDSKEEEEAFNQIFLLGEEIKREMAAIKKAEAEMLAKEKQAAQTKLLDVDFVNAYEAIKATPEDETAKSNFAKAREVILNRLYGGIPKSASTGTKSGDGAKRGSKTAEIRSVIEAMYVGASAENVDEVGKSVREHVIKDLGFNDGTANSVILAYEKELGLKS